MDTSITQIFEQHRPLLFGISYRMVASAMEAEDILQEAFLRFQRASHTADIQAPRAYLVSIVTRLCLDHLKSASVQREQYTGTWLPEPILTDALPEPDHESLSMAFLVLLESLNPVERAVFLLREVFDYDYAEIARWIDKSEEACRQIFSRAKKHVLDNRPRFQPSPEQQAQILSAFMAACYAGDMDALKAILSTDVSLWSDGGGRATAALRPLHGFDGVVRFVLGIMKQAPLDAQYQARVVNGVLSLIVRDGAGQVVVVIVPEIEADGQLHTLRLIRNPDKFGHLG